MVAIFGGSFFWLSMAPGRAMDELPRTAGRAVLMLKVVAPVALVSGIAWLAATIANMTGDVAGLVDAETLHAFFFETPFGPLAFMRLALLATLVAVALAPLAPMRRFAAVATVSALLLVSQAWLGHAAEGGDTRAGAAMIAAYVVHVLAGAAWVGALPMLLLATSEWRARSRPRDAALRLLSRFSAMAVAAVSLIVLSGIANAGFRINGSYGALASTAYGDVLFVKVGLVSAMLVLATVNRFVMMPQLTDQAGPSWTRLKAGIGIEVALGLLVLAAAALLGVTPPPQ